MVPLGWKHLTIVDWIRYLTASNVHHSRDIPRDAVFSQRLPLALETRYLEWEQVQAPDTRVAWNNEPAPFGSPTPHDVAAFRTIDGFVDILGSSHSILRKGFYCSPSTRLVDNLFTDHIPDFIPPYLPPILRRSTKNMAKTLLLNGTRLTESRSNNELSQILTDVPGTSQARLVLSPW
ncbi:hypothetical protein PAXINDRAFT_19630 [Paxillus involutus ATCC 200175]|uniref:Uncharacterized protein n=1 Tax=Paxillus involutus ATCC 200175 TaxID=664439 RepID=A0A0C9SN22_PAXIN|nr:hypothetical protein PAXINDRAFT_19630 [Paxillus involutus ATCC 200175]